MPITQEEHRGAVANYLAGKVREFAFQLHVVVDASDSSLASYRTGDPGPGDGPVIYGFSAFGNAMQSLKDALKTIGGEPITWSQVAQLSDGDFLAKSRNAMTHDGNPVINAWADGRYFVANDISRFGSNGEPIEIVRPQTDVRTLCLTFAAEFCAMLSARLRPLVGHYEIGGAGFDSGEVEAAIHTSDLIPAEVKALFAAKSEEIREAIAQAPPFDPVVKAIEELEKLSGYCSSALSAA
jgi:hypothetical protein